MKPKILVDSAVLIDIINDDETWFDWSAQKLSHYMFSHDLVINPIIYGEISYNFHSIQELENSLLPITLHKEHLPRESSEYLANAIFSYKKNGGTKKILMPDLLIGAHALCHNMQIMTRDIKRYRTYFPEVKLIAPNI